MDSFYRVLVHTCLYTIIRTSKFFLVVKETFQWNPLYSILVLLPKLISFFHKIMFLTLPACFVSTLWYSSISSFLSRTSSMGPFLTSYSSLLSQDIYLIVIVCWHQKLRPTCNLYRGPYNQIDLSPLRVGNNENLSNGLPTLHNVRPIGQQTLRKKGGV